MDLTPEQVHAFVGPKADYYLERWSRIQSEAGSRTLGFNWAAGLLTMSWLLYRRMYRWFWIAVAVWVGLTIIEMVALETAVHSRAKGLLALIVILSWITPVVWIVISDGSVHTGTTGTHEIR